MRRSIIIDSNPGLDDAVAILLALAEPEAAVGDTTYFCVVDAEGNAVSGIQSLNSGFGSGVTAGDTGILLNNRMAYWHLAPGHANRLAPGKRVRHTMNAPMVFKDDRLWAVEGTPGADNQVQVNLQVLTAMMDLVVNHTARDSDLVFGEPSLVRQVLPAMTRLRWVQATAAGAVPTTVQQRTNCRTVRRSGASSIGHFLSCDLCGQHAV